ncbi:MAG: sigma-70 family RNA polymerase sigma factor [Planctomycetaceae bacterium]
MDAHDDIRALLAAARDGRPDALGRIFEVARGHLLQLAERDLPSELRPKIGPSDLVQETAIEMQRGFDRFTGTTAEECFAWLREILRNNTVDAVRHYRERLKRTVDREVSLAAHPHRTDAGFVDPRRSPDASAIRREEADALADVLPRLPAEERQILELRYQSGLSFADIAAHLGRSPKTVRRLWYQALARAQRELAADGVVAAAPPEPPRPSP